MGCHCKTHLVTLSSLKINRWIGLRQSFLGVQRGWGWGKRPNTPSGSKVISDICHCDGGTKKERSVYRTHVAQALEPPVAAAPAHARPEEGHPGGPL